MDTEATADAAQRRAAKEHAVVEALDHALSAREEANTTIHVQASGVMNIKVLVTMTLNKSANNYRRWRSMFRVVLGKYNLKYHVLSDESYPT